MNAVHDNKVISLHQHAYASYIYTWCHQQNPVSPDIIRAVSGHQHVPGRVTGACSCGLCRPDNSQCPQYLIVAVNDTAASAPER
jgi:hypothetical protein